MGLVVLLLLLALATADLSTHRYKADEPVRLWTNKGESRFLFFFPFFPFHTRRCLVGPFPNPQETYPYYSLPFCRPTELEHYHSEGLGETILGYDLIASAVPITFQRNVEPTVLCKKSFTSEQVEQMRYAVVHEFWYQLFLDDLPLWGMVGEGVENAAHIFTHQRFSIGYREDRVLQVNLTSENPQLITGDKPMDFSYEVSFLSLSLSLSPSSLLTYHFCLGASPIAPRNDPAGRFFFFFASSLFLFDI